MSKAKQAANPFYAALVILGIAFTVTACAYGVMALKAARPNGQSVAVDSAGGLMNFLDEHGGQLLTIELVLLGIATVGAIGTDQYWNRGSQESRASTSNRTDRTT